MYNLTPPADTQKTAHDSQQIITLLETQLTDLKAQLQKAEARENALVDEKSKLLDLLSTEKKEKRALMPPPEEKQDKSSNWLHRLIRAR